MALFSLNTKSETDGYEPWVKFTNTALLLLKTERVAGLRERNTVDDIIMQRTDPSYLDYNHNGEVAGRKPDIAFLKLKRAQALHGTMDSWDEIAEARAAARPLSREERSKRGHINRGPNDAGLPYFDWLDVLFFSEHIFIENPPKSLQFEDLLVFEKLRAPPGQSFPALTSHLSDSVSSVSFKSRKRGIDDVLGSGSSTRRPSKHLLVQCLLFPLTDGRIPEDECAWHC